MHILFAESIYWHSYPTDAMAKCFFKTEQEYLYMESRAILAAASLATGTRNAEVDT